MIVWTNIVVTAATLDDEPQRLALERDLHAALDHHAARGGFPVVDHDTVVISIVRETDAALAERQARCDAAVAELGHEPHALARLGWLCAEAAVSGPSNAAPAPSLGS